MKDKFNPLGILSLIIFIIGFVISIYGYLNFMAFPFVIGGFLAYVGLIGSLANPYLKKNK